MNELTIFDGSSAIAPTGNARLDELNVKIAETMRPMGDVFKAAQEAKEAFYKASAPFFGEVKRDKLFEKGGYKSFDEYAMATFGIKKSMAYMIANVGIHFFLEDNEYTRQARETFTVSNLAELLKADRIALSSAIDRGELDSNTSQDDLRKFEDEHLTHKEAAKRKEKVLPTFTLRIYPQVVTAPPIAENVIKEDMYSAAAQYIVDDGSAESLEEVLFTSVKLEGDKPSAAMHFIAYTANGFTLMFEYRPYTGKVLKKAEQPAAPDIGSMSDADFATYIKNLKAMRKERGKEV